MLSLRRCGPFPLLLCLLPLCCGAESQFEYYEDSTSAPEYDDNTTLYYIFYSNASSEDLDRFLNYTGDGGFEDQDDSALTSSISPTERGRVEVFSSAPHAARGPVSRWIVGILLSLGLSLQQLEHTL